MCSGSVLLVYSWKLPRQEVYDCYVKAFGCVWFLVEIVRHQDKYVLE